MQRQNLFLYGQYAECLYQNVWYTVKIIGTAHMDGELLYKVHYCSWNDRYDEFVSEDQLRQCTSLSLPYFERSSNMELQRRQRRAQALEQHTIGTPELPRCPYCLRRFHFLLAHLAICQSRLDTLNDPELPIVQCPYCNHHVAHLREHIEIACFERPANS